MLIQMLLFQITRQYLQVVNLNCLSRVTVQNLLGLHLITLKLMDVQKKC